MKCAPQRAEDWVRYQDRLLLTDAAQFLAQPIPILLNRSGLNNLRLPSWSIEVRILLERNAAGNGTFLQPDPSTQQQWQGFINPLWQYTGAGTAVKFPGSTDALAIIGACVATKTHTVTFTLSKYAVGTITPACGGTNGTARSANGTFTEDIICGAGTSFSFTPSVDFHGEIGAVSVVSKTAPGDSTLSLYNAPDALASLRSTSPYLGVPLTTSLDDPLRHALWQKYDVIGSGLDLSLKLNAAYADGKVFASVWARRYWWGEGVAPV